MNTSKVLIQTHPGRAESYALTSRSIPDPAAGQVQVRVIAASLQPADWKIGAFDHFIEEFAVLFPRGVGRDFAGVVSRVGPGVGTVSVGDRVFGVSAEGAVSEHVLVQVRDVAHTPAGLDDVHAATLNSSGRTAVATLDVVQPRPGDTLLLGGGAGGVGIFAVQLAVRAGATVIATASPRNHGFLAELGALPVAYGEGLLERVRALAPAGIDGAVDTQGVEAAIVAAQLGAPRARIAVIAAGAENVGVAVTGYDAPLARAHDLAVLMAAGDLRMPVTEFPLADYAAAITAVATGHVRGKVVLTLGA